MAQIIDPLPPERGDKVLCCYVNATSKIQIARITDVPNWYFERVVFPGQRLIFEAISYAQLEIHTGMMASAILSDKISCESLRIESEAEANAEDSAPSEDEPSPELPVVPRFTQSSNSAISNPLAAVAFTPVDVGLI